MRLTAVGMAFLTLYLSVAAVSGLLIDYAVSFWLTHGGREDTFEFWHGFLIGLIPGIGQVSLLGALATFIFSFFEG